MREQMAEVAEVPVRTKRSGPAARRTVQDDEPLEGTVVVDPDLVFTTPDRSAEQVPSEAERTIAFEIDGEIYTIIRPHKFAETMRRLIGATSRRASEADAIWAGEEFLNKILTPDSVRRLQARLDDDNDPFREEDLYDYLGKIVEKLGENARATMGLNDRAPARARARGRR